MPEPFHIFGNDLVIDANGDLLLVDTVEETQQRILRRLLTNQGSYLWNLSYGAGLGAMVGKPTVASKIYSIIRSQIMQEQTVAATPAPDITLSATSSGQVLCNIIFTYAPTNQPVALNFMVPI